MTIMKLSSDSQRSDRGEEAQIGEIMSNKGSGRMLDDNARFVMEQRLGYDFSHVRIHADNYAARKSNELSAEAFTIGSDVFFNAGRYNPPSIEGQRLLAHELTHVVQQGGARGNAGQNLSVSEGGRVIQMERLSVYSQEPDASTSTGHAFVSLQNDRGQSEYYGFWPACTRCVGTDQCSDGELAQLLVPFAGVRGRVCDDRGHPFDARIDYTIGTPQYSAAKTFADAAKANPPRYRLLAYNCTDFAVEVAERADVLPPSAGWFVFTPEELSESISQAASRQRSCVMRLGGCPQTRPAGAPTDREIGEYNTMCRRETGYGGPDIFPSESECTGFYRISE
ncbi:MAG: DUF4157 domain-containing protein [Nitrospirales bacterium]|nr:DUF4157 domain-containing protein [Nitrospirales bacterium]